METEKLTGDNPNPQCSNYSCTARKLDEDLNPECVYHPGQPVFHEGYKYWACCKRKSLAFDDFLRQKGCEKGEHCWIPKPKQLKEILDDEVVEKIVVEQEKTIRPAITVKERPDHNAPLVSFQVETSPSLEKQIEQGKLPAEALPTIKKCQNTGCSVKLEDAEASAVCYFHSGEAVFHEGLKYWSCCKKKALEFDQFLKQKGCKEGQHRWQPDPKVDCRFDWHQTGTHVILAIYAKGYNPSSVSMKANSVRLQVSFTQPSGVFIKDWILFGTIDELNCHSCLFPTKIEIKLKKADTEFWADLEYKGNSVS